MTQLTTSEIEDLRTMYSQWVDFVYADPTRPLPADDTLQRSAAETISKLMKAAGPDPERHSIPSSEPSGSGYGESKTGGYGPV